MNNFKTLASTICLIISSSSVASGQTFGDITPNNFSNVYVSYDAQFNHFGDGFYGLGFETLQENGFGGTFSVHGNWGLEPKGSKGQLMFKFGPQYGYVLHPNIMVSAALRGFIYTYDKKKTNSNSTDQKVNGGITLIPKIHLRYEKFVLGIGYEFGWRNKLGKLAHNANISVGYDF